jgi:hypothetical protein
MNYLERISVRVKGGLLMHIFTIGGKKIYKLTENEYIERNASHKNIQDRISRYATLSKIESDKKHQLGKPCSNCFVLSLDKTF